MNAIRATTIVLATCAVAAGGLLGCARRDFAPPAGQVEWVRGELRATEEISLDKAWEASLAAVEDLEYGVKERRKDAMAGRVVAEQADGRDVRIQLDDQGEDLTQIRIRVGVFGDETVSRAVLERIRQHANAGPRAGSR
jgi:hypothetical protein